VAQPPQPLAFPTDALVAGELLAGKMYQIADMLDAIR